MLEFQFKEVVVKGLRDTLKPYGVFEVGEEELVGVLLQVKELRLKGGFGGFH